MLYVYILFKYKLLFYKVYEDCICFATYKDYYKRMYANSIGDTIDCFPY